MSSIVSRLTRGLDELTSDLLEQQEEGTEDNPSQQLDLLQRGGHTLKDRDVKSSLKAPCEVWQVQVCESQPNLYLQDDEVVFGEYNAELLCLLTPPAGR